MHSPGEGRQPTASTVFEKNVYRWRGCNGIFPGLLPSETSRHRLPAPPFAAGHRFFPSTATFSRIILSIRAHNLVLKDSKELTGGSPLDFGRRLSARPLTKSPPRENLIYHMRRPPWQNSKRLSAQETETGSSACTGAAWGAIISCNVEKFGWEGNHGTGRMYV